MKSGCHVDYPVVVRRGLAEDLEGCTIGPGFQMVMLYDVVGEKAEPLRKPKKKDPIVLPYEMTLAEVSTSEVSQMKPETIGLETPEMALSVGAAAAITAAVGAVLRRKRKRESDNDCRLRHEEAIRRISAIENRAKETQSRAVSIADVSEEIEDLSSRLERVEQSVKTKKRT